MRKRVLESLSKAFGIWLLILWLWKKTCLECKCVFLEVAPPKLIKEVLQGNTKNSRRASVLRYGSSQSHPIKIDVTISIGINCGKQFWLCSFNQGQLEKGNDREIVCGNVSEKTSWSSTETSSKPLLKFKKRANFWNN